jgi:hypothetical protein
MRQRVAVPDIRKVTSIDGALSENVILEPTSWQRRSAERLAVNFRCSSDRVWPELRQSF